MVVTRARQQTRHIAIRTPLPEDHVVLKHLEGREELSRLFSYSMELLSADDDIDPTQLIGHNVSVRISGKDSASRFINGYVSEFRNVGWTEKATTYRMVVVPWLWFLTLTKNCRIFQHETAPQIIEKIFHDRGFTDFKFDLNAQYPECEYCVQYRESDFDFVSRLMEEEGIFYFFKHQNGVHTLHMSDTPSAFFDLPQNSVEFAAPGKTAPFKQQIKQWEHGYRYISGGIAQQDFNFKTPSKNLLSSSKSVVPLNGNQAYEVYDYHGRYPDRRRGQTLANIRMQEIESEHDLVEGKGSCYSFTPGGKFELADHRSSREIGRSYALVAVETTATVGETYITGDIENGESTFENNFICIPATTAFRPQRQTSRPRVEGPQTAVVVGPPGEEIYPDEFGRVKVQFHWDREGQLDESSSCWIRASQGHAGKGWGGIDLPRIGEEVIVDFIEGDPDFPIITGRVYNADNMPPFALPDEKTRGGMKSNTHKGVGYNEISMDDTAGKEQIRVNGQYNMDTAVGNNQTLLVGVDRSADIGNNDSLTVGNDSTEQIGNNKTVEVGNDLNVSVGNKTVLNAGSSITLKCGASKIYMNSGGVITITGTIITTAAAASASVVAPMTQVVGGVMLTTLGGINVMSGGVCHVGAAGLASVSGGKVDLAATGTNSIKGGLITLN